MSGTDELFSFQEVGDDGIDIEAIFGNSAEAPSDPPPFFDETQTGTASTAPQHETETDSKATPAAMEKEKGTAADAEPKEETTVKTEAVEEKAGLGEEPEPDLFAAFSENAAGSASASQKEHAEANSSTGQQVSLFDKPAVFKYGSAREPINDASVTFEELRIAKADDFPELAEGKKVSWSVKYGDITKAIADPQKTTIATIKEEIEKSKAFLDALKKGKLKGPECYVSPQVRAGSKGIAAYKGVYPTVEAARKSGKIINLIPSSDGKIYELRRTELGEFIAPTAKVADFCEVRAGFTPALPLIPRELMGQLFSFFRSFMNQRGEFEAMALIYWDRLEERFVLHIPRQTTSKAFIGYRVEEGELPEDRYLHYADIHSHNSMAAEFSAVDDADEKATRLYLVVGRLDHFYPDISARVSCGGTFLKIDPADVIEGVGEDFPMEWLERVERDESCHKGRKGSVENPLECKCLEVVFG